MESTQIYSSELSPSLQSYIPTTTGDVCPSCISESLCSDTVDLTHCSLKSTERQPLTPPGSHADLMQISTNIFKPFITVLLSEKEAVKSYGLPKTKPQTPQPSRQLRSSYLSFPKLVAVDHHDWYEKEESKEEEISRHGPCVCQSCTSKNSQCPPDWSCFL